MNRYIVEFLSSVAGYLKELLSAARIEGLNLGLVQTAYANGSSTNYITKKLVSSDSDQLTILSKINNGNLF